MFAKISPCLLLTAVTAVLSQGIDLVGAGVKSAEMIARDINSDNVRRYDRLVHLDVDMHEIMDGLIHKEEVAEASSPYYDAVYEAYAQRLNYPSFEELADDVQSILEDSNFLLAEEMHNDTAQLSHNLRVTSKASYVVGGVSFVGAVGLKRYGIPYFSHPWSKWTYAEKVVSFKASGNIYKLTREINVKVAKGILTEAQGAAQIKRMSKANAVISAVSLKAWKTIAPDIASQVLSMTRTIKLANRAFRFFEVASVFVDIGVWIWEAIEAENTKAELKKYIKEFVPQRFAMKKFALLAQVWDKYELNITAAADTWVTLQDTADSGEQCYLGADENLTEKLNIFTEDMIADIAAITDQYVFDILEAEDIRRNSHRSNDPSLAQILEALENDDDEVEDPIQVDYELGTEITQLPASEITGRNVRYLELSNDKGAMWKLTGPFWSYQEADIIINDDGGDSNTHGPRHRFQEMSRTDSTVELKLMATEGNQVTTADPLTIDIGNGEIRWHSQALGVDGEFNSNLVPTNGWTVFFAPTIESPSPTPIQDVVECNRLVGWKLELDNGLKDSFPREMSRSKTSVKATNYLALYGIVVDPQMELDLVGNKLNVIVQGNVVRQEDVFVEAMLPRVTID